MAPETELNPPRISSRPSDGRTNHREMGPAYFAAGNPRAKNLEAKNLQGKQLIAEFDWCERYAWTLIGFIQKPRKTDAAHRPISVAWIGPPSRRDRSGRLVLPWRASASPDASMA